MKASAKQRRPGGRARDVSKLAGERRTEAAGCRGIGV
jgi:hypothetical protein